MSTRRQVSDLGYAVLKDALTAKLAADVGHMATARLHALRTADLAAELAAAVTPCAVVPGDGVFTELADLLPDLEPAPLVLPCDVEGAQVPDGVPA